MTADPLDLLRGWTKPTNFLRVACPETVFHYLAKTVVWSGCQRSEETIDHDSLLKDAVEAEPGLFLGLLCYLATLDVRFYNLQRRMCARTLLSGKAPAYVQRIAAALLISEPPSKSQPTMARNVSIIMAIAVGYDLGGRPTESDGDDASNPRSSCGRLAKEIGYTYSAVEKVWKSRREHLKAAKFKDADIIEFMSELDVKAKIFPMT